MNTEEFAKKYPEMAKWDKVHSEAQAILFFHEWLSSKKHQLAYYPPNMKHLYPVTQTWDNLVYEYFEIDPNKLERERRDLLNNPLRPNDDLQPK